MTGHPPNGAPIPETYKHCVKDKYIQSNRAQRKVQWGKGRVEKARNGVLWGKGEWLC